MAKRKDIKQDLLDQIERRGIVGSHYLDLIEDYINFYDIKIELVKDIKERGVSIKYQHGQNQWGYKKNDSITELTKVNSQMLRILKELGIEAKNEDSDSDDWEM